MADYIRDMNVKNPKTVKQFVRLVQKECQGQIEIEEAEFDFMFEENEGQNPAERIKCMIEAIRDAVKETDYEKIVEKMKQEMEEVGNRMKSCQTEQDRWEAAKWVFFTNIISLIKSFVFVFIIADCDNFDYF